MDNSDKKYLDNLPASELFEQMPFNIAVIDRDFRVVAANKSFEEYFGDWRGHHCYEVYQGLFQKECIQDYILNNKLQLIN